MLNVFTFGQPRRGKSTLIKKLAHELREFGPVGFFTEEVRGRGTRKGLKLTGAKDRKDARIFELQGLLRED